MTKKEAFLSGFFIRKYCRNSMPPVELSCHGNIYCERNFLPQGEIFCQRNFLYQEEISNRRKKSIVTEKREKRFPVTQDIFLSHDKKVWISLHGKKVHVTVCNILGDISCHKKKFSVTKKISCHWNKFHVIGRILQSQEKISPVYFPLFVLSLFVFRIWLYSLLFKPIGSPHTFDTIQH